MRNDAWTIQLERGHLGFSDGSLMPLNLTIPLPV